MIKKLFVYFSLFALGGFLSLVLFEGMLRVIERSPAWKVLPVAEVSLYGPDEFSGYTLRPNVNGVWVTENRARVTTSSYGIRSNGQDDFIADEDYYKIGIIGDSITEALQVEDHETFSARIEQKFKNENKKFRVYNLGLAGATPAVEAARAKYYAEMLNLDLIIVVEDPSSIAFTLNKSDGALPYYAKNADGDVVVNRPYLNSKGFQLKQSSFGTALFSLLDNSKLFTALNARMNRGIFDEFRNPFVKSVIYPKDNKSLECDVKSLETISNFNFPDHSETGILFSAFVEDLKSIEVQNNTQVVFSLYDTWSDCPSDLEAQSRNAIKKILLKQDIQFLDLKSELQKNLSENISLNHLRGFADKQGIGHLNVKGHDVFAKAINNLVVKNVQ